MFWYAFLRIGLDLLRDYPTHRLALGTGQTLNIVMAVVGALLLWRSRWRRLGRFAPRPTNLGSNDIDRAPSRPQAVAFAAVALFSTTIASNWTQDVPAKYSARHPGLVHSWLYPAIDTSPPRERK